MGEWSKHRDRNNTIRCLRNDGWSIGRIADHLGCSKSVVSYHCKGTKQTPRNGNNGSTNKVWWENRRNEVKTQATDEWTTVRKDSSMMLVLGLYWGEGSKNNQLNITNNDPAIIKIVYDVLSKLTDKPIRAEIVYYGSHNVDDCWDFWAGLLPNAIITLRKNKDARSKIGWCDRCPKGRCRMSIGDYRLYWRLITWIEIIQNGGMV